PVVIHFLHRVTAVAVALCAALCGARAFASKRSGLRKTAVALMVLVAAQVALGALTVLTRKSVPVTTLHVATGALILGTALAFTLASLKTASSAGGARRAAPGPAKAVARAAAPRRSPPPPPPPRRSPRRPPP